MTITRGKKRIMALAVTGALTGPLMAQAADSADVSGFIDVIANSDSTAVFVSSAEIDISKKVGAVSVRADIDANLVGNSGFGAQDSGRLEQAYFAWSATKEVTVLGGLFNNPLGQEQEDAPDIGFTSHSVTWNVLDGQTGLYGNNLAGIAAAGTVGPATVTLAVVDDLGFATNAAGTKGKTSVALVVNAKPISGLDIELGYVTQDDQEVAGVPTTAGNVLDVNAAFKTGQISLGLDYLAADNAVDTATNLWVGFDVNNKINVKARYETIAFEANGIDDSTRTTLYGAYAINDNLSAALEWSAGETVFATNSPLALGIIDDDTTILEFIGTF